MIAVMLELLSYIIDRSVCHPSTGVCDFHADVHASR